MNGAVFVRRLAILIAPLGLAAYAGCSDSTDAPAPVDAGIDTVAPDTGTTPDASSDASDAGRNCATDVQADGLYRHLECTGLYDDFAAKKLSAGAKPYKPALEFWSDGAEKSRFIALPSTAKIDITDFDEWTFPNGTKVWKEFKIGGKRIETRLFEKANDAWRHTVYRWNDAETDAERKDSGESLNFSGRPPYEIPNTGQCDVCHLGRKEPLLGIDGVSLALPGATGVTLATLAADGKLSKTPPYTTITIPENAGGKAAPALGWLHANCGSCHNKNGTAAAQFTLFFTLLTPSQLAPPEGGTATVESLDPWITAVGKNSTKVDPDAGTPYLRIAGGDPGASLVAIMSGRRVPPPDAPNTTQMPPLVTRLVDTAGHKLLTDWITVIPP